MRPSWCYGTPGIARAQQLAAIALGDTARQYLVEAAFTRCVTDLAQTRRLTDRSLCHGTAGLLVTARRIAADAIAPTPLTQIEDLHQQVATTGNERAGFLEGIAGSELAAIRTTATSWDACLLLT